MSQWKWSVIKEFSIGWTVGLVFYALIRNVGTIDREVPQLSITDYLSLSLLLGPFFGAISGMGQLLFEVRFYKKMPFHKLAIIRGVISISILTLMIVVVYHIFMFCFGVTDTSFVEMATYSGSLIFYAYIIFLDMVMSMIRQVNLLLGSGTLRKLMRGEFYSPKEEERIFMFLDLKSSTALAERLGHVRYSEMIQDCFDDLAIVMEHGAEIYQYVGDEAVLSWEKPHGIKAQNCIEAYFQFIRQIECRKDHYLSKYDCIPFFKAGLNIGLVTVAEVGKFKKEIAYHGDTINTAARIQEKCNELDKALLIPERLKNALGQFSRFTYEFLGMVPLKGKTGEVMIYAVSEKT